MITITALVLALLVTFSPQFFPIDLNYSFIAMLMAASGTAVLFLVPLLNTLWLTPMGRLENFLVPRLMDIFRKDRLLALIRVLLLLFPLISYVLAIALVSDIPYKLFLTAFWILAFGLTLELIKNGWKRVAHLLNPFYTTEVFSQEARRYIQEENSEGLTGSIDSLSEIALHSIERSQIALSTQTLSSFPAILQDYYSSYKSLAHTNLANERVKGRDQASFTVYYILQQLDLIYHRALNHGLETVCNQMMLILGKIIVYSARFDLSMMTFPVRYLGKFGVQAQHRNKDSIADLAISTLLETSKTVVNEIDLTYAELVDPFQAVITAMENIIKNTFKKDKTINIQVLIQPLRDLRTLFETPKMAEHRDTPVILQSIDAILAEFDALEQVMRTIPTIPTDQA